MPLRVLLSYPDTSLPFHFPNPNRRLYSPEPPPVPPRRRSPATQLAVPSPCRPDQPRPPNRRHDAGFNSRRRHCLSLDSPPTGPLRRRRDADHHRLDLPDLFPRPSAAAEAGRGLDRRDQPPRPSSTSPPAAIAAAVAHFATTSGTSSSSRS